MRSLELHELAWTLAAGVLVLMLTGSVWWGSLAIVVVALALSAMRRA